MTRLKVFALLTIGILMSSPALAKNWDVHNTTDGKYNVLFQATGCGLSVSCGTGGKGREYGTVCKKKQVEAQEKISYDWGIGGQSDKRVIVCDTDGGNASGSQHHETYICKGPNAKYWKLKGGSCD